VNLGEWHTHPQKSPRPSKQGQIAMSGLYQKSKLNTNALLLIIVGQGRQSDAWHFESWDEPHCSMIWTGE